jgi:hypothetical protein
MLPVICAGVCMLVVMIAHRRAMRKPRAAVEMPARVI